MRAPVHPRQLKRLSALRDLAILDTEREGAFDEIVAFVAEACETPIAVINLIDEDRQWFKAEVGLGMRETPVDNSICSHVILQPGLTVIPDTLADDRLRDNPLCLGGPGLRFYAGATLMTDDGLPIGTLCVLDTKPRVLSGLQKTTIDVLSRQVMKQLLLRRELQRSQDLSAEIDHRVKNSLSLVGALLNLQVRNTSSVEIKQALAIARDRVSAIGAIHEQLHTSGSKTHVDLAAFAQRLGTSLEKHAPSNIAILVEMPAVEVPARNAVSIGTLLNELTTNALRHAFAASSSGTIRITGNLIPAGISFAVVDDGGRLPADFDPARSKGLGMRLALSLAQELGGGLAWSSAEGATTFSFELELPEIVATSRVATS